MYELTASPKSAQPWFASLVRYALPAAILLALIGVLFAHRGWTARPLASTQAATEFISASPIEDRYGIRVTLIGVTAAGGLIAFRFKVLDAERAKEILQDPENMPMLIAEDSGTTLKVPGTVRHNITLETGRGYYILYINTQGAIKPGSPVSVVIGDLRLEHIVAQWQPKDPLIAVTVGGGMIDFCLKILNAEKAQHFLQDPANLPRLIAAKSVALSTYSYLATANHDPDGESDGTTIAVLKP